jgi:hypothetical protein
MLLEDRLVLNYPYVLQCTSLPYEIHSVEEPYLRTSDILGTCDVSALGIHRMCLH